MSTWTSDITGSARAALLGALILPLAGCLGEGGGTPGAMGFLSGGAAPAPLRRIALYDGAVVVAGPPGYCIDGRAVRRGRAGNFVLLASCAQLSGSEALSVDPAMITVSVLSYTAGVTQPTAAQITRSAAPARALRELDGDGVSLVHLDSGGDAAVPGGDPRYWRAGMVVNGHLIGLAIYGGKGSAVAGDAGLNVLMEMAETLREESPERAPAAPDSPDAPAPVAKTGTGSKSVFSGLFPKAN